MFEKEAVFLDHAREGDLAFIREAVETGAVVDIDLRGVLGQTALSLACEHGHLALVDYLCRRGANTNLAADDGCTPLHFAIDNNHEDLAATLLDHGANGRIANAEGETPLDWARESGMARIAAIIEAKK